MVCVVVRHRQHQAPMLWTWRRCVTADFKFLVQTHSNTHKLEHSLSVSLLPQINQSTILRSTNESDTMVIFARKLGVVVRGPVTYQTWDPRYCWTIYSLTALHQCEIQFSKGRGTVSLANWEDWECLTNNTWNKTVWKPIGTPRSIVRLKTPEVCRLFRVTTSIRIFALGFEWYCLKQHFPVNVLCGVFLIPWKRSTNGIASHSLVQPFGMCNRKWRMPGACSTVQGTWESPVTSWRLAQTMTNAFLGKTETHRNMNISSYIMFQKYTRLRCV